MIRQVSSTLLSPTERMKVQLSVGLIDSSNNPSYCSIYNGSSSYLNISPFTQLVIRYLEKGRPWNKMDNLYVTQRNIFGLRTDIQIFYTSLMNHADDIYKYGKSGYISSMGDAMNYRRVIPLGVGQTLSIEPTIVYGDRGRPLPGVRLEINVAENLVELSMDEFESFYDLIQHVDLHLEGMLLLQSYMLICLKSGGLSIPLDKDSSSTGYKTSAKDIRVNIFESAQRKRENEQQKEIVSGPNPIKQPTTLEELEGGS